MDELDENTIYGTNFDAKIKRRLDEINLQENRKTIEDFLIETNLMKKTKLVYTIVLRNLSNFVNKPFQAMIREDIRDHYKNESSRLAAISVWMHFSKIKRFFKWLNNEEYPESVKWIKTTRKKSSKGEKKKIKEKIIPRDIYVKLLEHCDHLRDKAFISFMWDTGCRIHELVPMRIKDLELDATIPKAFVGQKRWVILIESITFLTAWLSVHPYRNDPDTYLWLGQKGPLSVGGFSKIWVKTRKKAGSPHIKLHWLRHTRATHHALKNISETHMKKMMGWAANSNLPAIYIHLIDKESLEIVGRAYGLNVPEEQESEEPITKICFRCSRPNLVESKFCNVCGMGFDLEAIAEREHRDDLVYSIIMENPEIKDKILKELAKVYQKELNEKDNE